jgi:hypothetical protein
METNEIVQAPEHYNPNQLVTYKVIDDGNATYPTSKVVDLEWKLENARRTEKQLSSLRLSVSNLEEMLPGWIEDETDTEEIVSQICNLFGFNPTKEIEFEASVIVRGTVNIPLAYIADFDIDSVDLYVDVNAYSYDINAEAEVENIITL